MPIQVARSGCGIQHTEAASADSEVEAIAVSIRSYIERNSAATVQRCPKIPMNRGVTLME